MLRCGLNCPGRVYAERSDSIQRPDFWSFAGVISPRGRAGDQR